MSVRSGIIYTNQMRMQIDELKQLRAQYEARFEEINSMQVKIQAELLRLLDQLIESPPKKKSLLLSKQMKEQAWPSRRKKH